MSTANPSAIPVTPPNARPRLDSVDLLRGWIMVIMALDHTRDFFSRDAILFDPSDLTQTTVPLFLTRWITHFCAPVFFFLAGTGAFLSTRHGKTKGEVARFLITRGLWLIVLELTLVQLGWGFRIDFHFLALMVIWALGWSMMALAALTYLPLWAIMAFGAVVIAGHNLLDPVTAEAFGAFGWLWKILHVQSGFRIAPGYSAFVVYPLIPWIGVMACGYAFGALLRREQARRRTIVLWIGVALVIAFVVVRALNIYGDPQPWSPQADPSRTVLSFLNCAKYPPSLLYLLMTLGPAIIVIALFDRKLGVLSKPFIVVGRVPLFFYLLHLPIIHGLAVFFAYLRHGYAGGLWHGPVFSGDAAALPPNYGYGLLGVYGFWMLAVLLLYPLCHWFAALKQRRGDPWLSYF
jgi:uncharacterized membrane protein